MAATIQNIELPKLARARDTSGNNNHGQIYSGRALEFDGVADNLRLDGFTLEGTKATVAFWINAATTTGYVIDLNSTIRFVVGFSSNKFKFYDGNGWKQFGTIATDVYLRCVVVLDGTVAKGFVNGHQLGTDQTIQNISIASNTTAAIGSDAGSAGSFLTANLSDFQLWNKAFTQADVTYDYLNPEQTAISGGGTALTESNLKLWYPMQDGHRGQQSYILDGANTGLGNDVVTNGDFATDSDWALIQATISNGDLNILTADGSFAHAIQNGAVQSGKTYKYSLNIKSLSGNLGLIIGGVTNIFTTAGIKTGYLTSVGTSVEIKRAGGSLDAVIDNVSVKAINDKHHATTVFHGDELYDSTASTNGNVDNWQDFGNNVVASDSGTVKGTYVDNASGVYLYLKGANDLISDMIVGRTYQFQYDIKVNTGSVTPSVAVTGASTISASAVTSTSFITQTIDFVCSHATLHFFYTGGMGAGEIVWLDNFSLKEVGTASGWTDADQQLHIPQTALQSYNELAWFSTTTADNAMAIVSDNADFDINSSDFTANFWVYLNDYGFGGGQYVFHKGGGGGEGWHMRVRPDGQVDFVVADGGSRGDGVSESTANSGAAGVKEGQWHMITGVVDHTNTVALYIDGVLIESTAFPSDDNDIDGSGGLEMLNWAHNYTNGTLNGTATEFTIFKGAAFSAAEVIELYNDGKALDATTHSQVANLKGYWRNDGLNTTWKNINNPGTHDATFQNGTETILIPQGIDSSRDSQGFIMNKQKDTSCLNLTNSSDNPHVDLGSTTTIAADGTASFVVWLKPDDVIGNYFMGKGASQDSIKINSATSLRFRANNVDDTFTVGTIIPGDWIHVAVVKAGSGADEMTVYINGTASTDTETSIGAFDYRYIGAERDSIKSFRGAIDGFLIYESALSQPEVERNYKATKGSHRN